MHLQVIYFTFAGNDVLIENSRVHVPNAIIFIFEHSAGWRWDFVFCKEGKGDIYFLNLLFKKANTHLKSGKTNAKVINLRLLKIK